MVRRVLFPLVLALATACGGSTPNPANPAPPLEAKVTSTPAIAVDPPQERDEDASPIPVGKDDATWGNRSALVTLVEMTDLQCPFCSRAHVTVRALEDKYGPDQLRVVWKHNPLPFHPNARPSAEWAQGVFAVGGREAFQCFVGRTFQNQSEMNRASYEKWTTECGANAKSVAASVDGGRSVEKVERDIALAKRLDANGTPTFFVNGALLSGAQPLEKFTKLIDAHLEIAKDLVQKGAPRDALYVVISTAVMQAEKENGGARRHDDDDDDEKPDTEVYRVPVGQSPQRGPATAPVTIVEFSDFQCPYCKRVEDVLTKVREKYEGQVRFVWKDEPLPFHPRAEPAAQLAREARAQKGDLGFWKAHDALFESQPKLEDEDLLAVAKKLGLDIAKVKGAISSHKYKQGIDADEASGEDFAANGTPHFFINGRRLVGAQPLEKFVAAIDEALKRADALTAKGVAPAKLYEELVKDGKGPAMPEKKTVALPAKAPTRGPAGAVVTVQEFADFQCPFCGRAEGTVKELLAAYPGKVKLVYRHLPLPFHQHAELAAEAAAEAYAQKGDGGFYQMHDQLYANQAHLERADLDGYAKTIGLDMKRFAHALDTSAHKSAIDADAKAAHDAGITGTPAFVINGYLVSGAQPLSKFKKAVDLALSDAVKH